MRMSLLGRVSVSAAIIVVASGPLLAGSLPVLHGAPACAAISAFCLYAFGRADSPLGARKIALSALSFCLVLACLDLAARPVVALMVGEEPREISPREWPPMPLTLRFE